MTLIVLRGSGQIFCKLSLSLHLSDVFLMMTPGLWLLGKNTTEVKYPSHQVISVGEHYHMIATDT